VTEEPGVATDFTSTAARYRAHLSRGTALIAETLFPVTEVRSEGAYVFDSSGRRYLDVGGFGVFLLGHRHPRVVESVKAQLDRHPMSTRLLLDPTVASAAEALARAAPGGLECAFFTNSGTEAVEAALKLARLNGKRKVIAAEGGFHGKTFGSLSAAGREVFRAPFEPLVPDTSHVPFGDAEALEAVLGPAGEEACVLLEPVQGESGVRVPPAGYLRDVEAACRRRGAILILDEVLTGLGRLGRWWGGEAEHVSPDIITAGKALSGGVFPVGAMVATPECYEPLNRDPFLHTSTFGGSPLAAAAVEATIAAIREEGVVERVAERSAELADRVQRGLEPCRDLIAEIRCRGFLVGIEFESDAYAGELIYELVRQGVIVSASLNAGRVVRLTPPAIMSGEDLEWLEGALETSAEKLARYASSERRGAYARG
jgi:putrescine aminotransferase